jgi:hypothetical protein
MTASESAPRRHSLQSSARFRSVSPYAPWIEVERRPPTVSVVKRSNPAKRSSACHVGSSKTSCEKCTACTRSFRPPEYVFAPRAYDEHVARRDVGAGLPAHVADVGGRHGRDSRPSRNERVPDYKYKAFALMLGIDKSLPEQYWTWVVHAVRGVWGTRCAQVSRSHLVLANTRETLRAHEFLVVDAARLAL